MNFGLKWIIRFNSFQYHSISLPINYSSSFNEHDSRPTFPQVSIGSAGSWRSEQSEKTDINAVNIPITVSLVILFALLYGGTELFQNFEDWDPLTSFYFCFISLTTIGFGDFVPGSSSENQENFIYCSLYLMFGLALLSMCFNLMQEEVVHKVTLCMKSVTLFKRRQLDSWPSASVVIIQR